MKCKVIIIELLVIILVPYLVRGYLPLNGVLISTEVVLTSGVQTVTP